MANKKDIIKKKKGEVIKEAKVTSINEKKDEIKERKNAGVVIILMTLVMLSLILTGLYWYYENEEGDQQSLKGNFKQEYEKLNGVKNKDGNEYLSVSIPKENIIQYASYEKIFQILKDQSGIIYFGFPECPWCRTLIPVLLDAADEVGIDTIYYLNAVNDRDIKKLDENGKIVEEKKATENYQKLLKKLDSVLESYEGLNNPDIKRLYFPTVLFVKEGKIIDIHIGTIASQEDAFQKLSNEDKESLKEELMGKMNQVITCSDAC